MKKPKFVIFTDRDGTLNLEDEQLNSIIKLIEIMKGMIIPTTGRTVGDIQESIIKQKLIMPQIIIGDNGANIYSTKDDTFLIKKLLDHEKVITIIKQFINNGGNPNYIRYTNGENVFASNTQEVKQYYAKSSKVKFYDDICRQIEQTKDITKIVLTGNKSQMKQSFEFSKKLEFWTDMDRTKFPKKEYQNYRLDIAQKNINKGEAVKALISLLKPEYGYVCIGNGYNDISMFEMAIKDGMIAAIMSNSPYELKKQLKDYCKNIGKGKVVVIPNDKDLANKYLLRIAKQFQTKIETKEKWVKQENKRLPNLQRIQVNNFSPKTNNIELKDRNRDR